MDEFCENKRFIGWLVIFFRSFFFLFYFFLSQFLNSFSFLFFQFNFNFFFSCGIRFETSAKENTNIDKGCRFLVSSILESNIKLEEEKDLVRLEPEQNPAPKTCC